MSLELPENVLFCQVDAHNIVPVWVAADQQVQVAKEFEKIAQASRQNSKFKH